MDRLSLRPQRREGQRSALDSFQRRRRSGTADAEKGSVDDFAWAPDSKQIVLVVHDPDPRDPEAKEKEKKTVPPIVIDRFQFKKDIDGYLTNRWSHLKLLHLATRKLDSLTSGEQDDLLPAWSPDGKQIAFATKRGPDADRTENWDLYLIEPKPGAKERQLTTALEADAHPEWESAPAWSPDSKTIAYFHGGDPKKISYATHSLAIIPAAGGEPQYLTAASDRNAAQPQWAPDGKSIFAVVEDDGAESLVRVALAGGADSGQTVSPTRHRGRAAQGDGLRREQRWQGRRPGQHAGSTLRDFRREKDDLRCLTKQNDRLSRRNPAWPGRGN